MSVTLDLTTPLLAALALLNAACVFYAVSRRVQLFVGVALVGLALWLLTDWVEGLLYLVRMP